MLFQDDFARNSGGWSRHDGPDFWAGLDDGWYRLRILQPNTDGWSNPGLSFGNVRIEVEAIRRGGPEDNLLGVICRYQDGQDFYFLVISSDGYAGIGKLQAGQRRLIGTEALLPSPAVARGNASNHLTAECVGDRLRLSVNSVLVAEGRDPAWSVGDVGLLAGASAQPGVDVAFDNFSVLQPGAKDSP